MQALNRGRSLLISVAVMMLLPLSGAWAHETRPAYLEINEAAPGRYDVLWRTPVQSGMRLPVELQFAESARNVIAPAVRELSDSLLERRVIEVPGGLAGKRIEFAGLQGTITDVLARVQLRDGAYSTTLIQYWAAKEGNGAVQMVGPIFRPEKYAIVVAEGSALRKPINEALLEIYDDGTYEKINAKWFSQSK